MATITNSKLHRPGCPGDPSCTCGGSWPRSPTVLSGLGVASGRVIRQVFLVNGDANDVAHHLKQQGLHPRVYARHARAENMTVRVWVVCCDVPAPDEPATVDGWPMITGGRHG
jgi:hypothetical protein